MVVKLLRNILQRMLAKKPSRTRAKMPDLRIMDRNSYADALPWPRPTIWGRTPPHFAETDVAAPHVKVMTEQGQEITPKSLEVQEDEAGVFLITITIDDADLSGSRTFGT